MIKFSATEQKLLNILLARKTPITSEALAAKLYAGVAPDDVPFHARTVVHARISDIMRKTKRSKEFRIYKSPRCGPYPISYWAEKK